MILERVGNAAPPQRWSDPLNDPVDGRYLTNIRVQIVGTPSTPYTPVISMDGSTYVPCTVFDAVFADGISISTAGIFTIPGGNYVKFSGGAGSTLYVGGNAE